MIHQGGAIHQPYFVILGVEAQRFEVRSAWMAPLSCFILTCYFRAKITKEVALVTYEGKVRSPYYRTPIL